jgi:hypothetical protein
VAGAAFTSVLSDHGIVISMDRKRGMAVFVERLWRSVKYEEVYLQAYESVGEARASAKPPRAISLAPRKQQLIGNSVPTRRRPGQPWVRQTLSTMRTFASSDRPA